MAKFHIKSIPSKVKQVAVDFKSHWNVPAEGNYISGKEFLRLAFGSAGTSGIGNVLGYLSFAASCLLVGSIYGISFKDIYVCGIIGMIVSYIYSPISMVIQDNLGNPPKRTMKIINVVCLLCFAVGVGCFFIPQESTEKIVPALPQIVGGFLVFYSAIQYYNLFVYKKLSPKYGKFRPFVIVSCLPALASILLIVFLPFQQWNYPTKLWVLQLLFNAFGTFSAFYNQKDNIMYLMTPNAQEKANIMTVEQLISAAIGGLSMILFPVLTIYTGGLTGINTYRILIPAFVLLFTPLVLLQAFGLKERVFLEKEHKTNVNMVSGFKQVLKNKYMWITNISGLMGNITAGSVAILTVIVVYSLRKDYLSGLLTALPGVLSTPGLLVVPFCVKKFGKKKTMIYSRLFQCILYAVQFIGLWANNVWVLYIGLGGLQFFSIISWMVGKLMTPDIWDYQQYKSGERLEGCSGIFGLLTNPVAKVLAFVVPAIYLTAGFTSDWGILYFPDVRQKIYLYTVIITFASHVLTTLPYFFYDLTEEKHAKIIRELQQRAEEADKAKEANEQQLAEISE